MKFIVKLATIFYYYTIQQVFNLLGRTYWYLRILLSGRWSETTDLCEGISEEVKDFTSLNNIYMTFKYQFDGLFDKVWVFDRWPTWVPTIRILMARGTSDNCDGAVIFAQSLYDALFEKHPEAKKELKLKLRVIVPYNSFKNFAERTHYVLEVIHEKEKWVAIYSSGKIYAMSIEEFAAKYTKTDRHIVW